MHGGKEKERRGWSQRQAGMVYHCWPWLAHLLAAQAAVNELRRSAGVAAGGAIVII